MSPSTHAHHSHVTAMSLNQLTVPKRVRIPSAAVSRIPGLEWFRAGLAIAVLAFHSAVPYLRYPFPGLRWSTYELGGSPLVDAFAWVIAAAAMPAFFLLSGFLSARIYASRGSDAFLRDRTRRLLPALIFGGLLILPLTGYAWFLGWAAQGYMPLQSLWQWGIPDELEEGLYGAGHLWFLELLWIFCVSVWAIHWLSSRFGTPTSHSQQLSNPRVLSSAFMPLLFALPGAVVLAIEPRVAIGFQQSFVPPILKVLYYAPCFAVGFWLHGCQDGRGMLTRWCEWRLLFAGGLFALLLPRIQLHSSAGSSGFDRWLLAGYFSAFAWIGAMGFMGACLKYLNRSAPPAVSLLSQASLWIYIVHVPIVGLLQVDLLSVPVPLVVKFLIVVAGGLMMSLATYHVVRRSWVGRLLEPQSVRPETIPLPEKVHGTRAIAPLVSP